MLSLQIILTHAHLSKIIRMAYYEKSTLSGCLWSLRHPSASTNYTDHRQLRAKAGYFLISAHHIFPLTLSPRSRKHRRRAEQQEKTISLRSRIDSPPFCLSAVSHAPAVSKSLSLSPVRSYAWKEGGGVAA